MSLGVAVMKRLFRVDNPSDHALIDGQFPVWQDTAPDFEAHAEGKHCLCITPIGKDGTCYFGALDLDAKGSSPAIPHKQLQAFIEEHSLPLNLFYSKSGKGAHAFLFSPVPVPASDMQSALNLYANLIASKLHEMHHIEIFPKQSTLREGDNGSCIRIPCFGEGTQPCFEGEPKVVRVLSVPPCLENMPEEGERNDFAYHISNFFYLSEATGVKTLVKIINDQFTRPMPDKEVDRTADSARKNRNRNESGFGLGCTDCPSSRKQKCKFASQIMSSEMDTSVQLVILTYISKTPEVQITVEGHSHVFPKEDAIMIAKVSLVFAVDYGVDFPFKGKQKDWKAWLIGALPTATRVNAISEADKGHAIVAALKKWSTKFNTGMDKLYSGSPVFINDDEILISSNDVFQYFMRTNALVGVTSKDIDSTLATIGKRETVDGHPFFKVKASAIKINITPALAVPVINDIDEKDVMVEVGHDGVPVYKDKIGQVIELTNTWLQEHPAVRKKVVELSKENNSKDIGF